MSAELTQIAKNEGLSLYEAKAANAEHVRCFVASTKETRAICNDPFVTGLEYTRTLSSACARVLSALTERKIISLAEDDTTVFHILRGGLNFGLRDALAEAFKWNNHASAYISAQRARKSPKSEDWIITESEYKKIHLPKRNNIVFGDVVATGSSLEFALKRIKDEAVHAKVSIERLIFFTIGGPRSHEILNRLSAELKQLFPGYKGSHVVYLEGIFSVATTASPLSVKIDGTDLLRRESVLAPEFVQSQYESPSFPIERCTIYDAGSRAFDTTEYFHDITEYWEQVRELAAKGMTFQQLVAERMPELDPKKFGAVTLADLVKRQLEKIPSSENAGPRSAAE